MVQNKEIIFEVMVTFPNLLIQKVDEYNKLYKTNFKVVDIIDDEVQFCKIKVSEYNISDIFNLGYSLAVLQYRLREKGEIDW